LTPPGGKLLSFHARQFYRLGANAAAGDLRFVVGGLRCPLELGLKTGDASGRLTA
jgi:hypothetical protein